MKSKNERQMSNAKHTPGPWAADYFDRVDSTDGQIAILNKGVRDGQCAANSRLIAAAPELLETLETIAKELDRDAFRLINSNRPGDQSVGNTISWAIAMCENAIAKATGGVK